MNRDVHGLLSSPSEWRSSCCHFAHRGGGEIRRGRNLRVTTLSGPTLDGPSMLGVCRSWRELSKARALCIGIARFLRSTCATCSTVRKVWRVCVCVCGRSCADLCEGARHTATPLVCWQTPHTVRNAACRIHDCRRERERDRKVQSGGPHCRRQTAPARGPTKLTSHGKPSGSDSSFCALGLSQAKSSAPPGN